MNRWRKIFRIGLGSILVMLLPAAEIEVEGLGWRTELRLERLLEEIILSGEGTALTESIQVEDALLILRNEMERVGYLAPDIRYMLFSNGREMGSGRWELRQEVTELPWEEGDRIRFEVVPGERAYFETVLFEGLNSISEDEARTFFYPATGLFVTESQRAYSPSALQSGLDSLTRRLSQFGFLRATARPIGGPHIAPTGEVSVTVRVEEGPQFRWGTTRLLVETENAEARVVAVPNPHEPGSVFTDEREEDFVQRVRNRFLGRGFPDVWVSAERSVTMEADGQTAVVDLAVRIQPGQRVRLGAVRFEGIEATDPGFVAGVADLERGAYLNRLEVERAQFDLGRLGIFERLRTRLEPLPDADEPQRDVVFTVEERGRRELSVLAGYGSYEMLRVGLEARALNLFGRAHSARLRLRQSFKSTAGQLVYSVPRPVFGIEQGQARILGLQREEVSFTREEALVAFGVERAFFNNAIQASAEYRFELLRSVDLTSGELIGDTRATVGSVLVALAWDTRDRIISPRNGEQVRAQLELATPTLGSDAHFQRFQVKTSLHRSFDHDRLRWHFGLEGGLLSRVGSDPSQLPVNKRFFPGGENSVRGYREGEASPRDAEGEPIGAEAYILGHVEFELQVLQSLSLVLFTDGVWSTPDLGAAKGEDALFSSGLGLRYSTPLGPLRLEYGHNLNPRPRDPRGVLHFSIGFPF